MSDTRPWWSCSCGFDASEAALDGLDVDARIQIVQAHHLEHITDTLIGMQETADKQLELIRKITGSAFLNPRHAGESPAQRVERVNGGQ